VEGGARRRRRQEKWISCNNKWNEGAGSARSIKKTRHPREKKKKGASFLCASPTQHATTYCRAQNTHASRSNRLLECQTSYLAWGNIYNGIASMNYLNELWKDDARIHV
jgi:hypothetical protein